MQENFSLHYFACAKMQRGRLGTIYRRQPEIYFHCCCLGWEYETRASCHDTSCPLGKQPTSRPRLTRSSREEVNSVSIQFQENISEEKLLLRGCKMAFMRCGCLSPLFSMRSQSHLTVGGLLVEREGYVVRWHHYVAIKSVEIWPLKPL